MACSRRQTYHETHGEGSVLRRTPTPDERRWIKASTRSRYWSPGASLPASILSNMILRTDREGVVGPNAQACRLCCPPSSCVDAALRGACLEGSAGLWFRTSTPVTWRENVVRSEGGTWGTVHKCEVTFGDTLLRAPDLLAHQGASANLSLAGGGSRIDARVVVDVVVERVFGC